MVNKNNIHYTVQFDKKTKVEVVKLPAENLYNYSVVVKLYSEQFDTWKLEEEIAEYEPSLFKTQGEVYGHIEYLKLVHSQMNTIKFYYTLPVFCELESLDPTKVTYHDLIIQNNYYETIQAINYMDILISNYNFDLKIRLEVLKDFGENNQYVKEFIDNLLETYKINNYSIKDLTGIIQNEIEEYREKITIEHHNFLKEVK